MVKVNFETIKNASQYINLSKCELKDLNLKGWKKQIDSIIRDILLNKIQDVLITTIFHPEQRNTTIFQRKSYL